MVVGFDGMDANLVRAWAEEGLLPTFRALLSSSAWCTFDIAPEYSSGMVWPSINTGLPPGEHRAGFGTQLIDGSYKLRPRPRSDIHGEPFWKAFADRGRRVVVADIPFSPVIPECGGQQFWGWGQHDWSGYRASQPSNLLTDLERQFGAHPLRYAMDYSLRTESLRRLRDDVFAAIEQRARLLRSLLRPSTWDLFYAAFTECHSAGHMFWHLNDGGHPAHSPQQKAQIGNALQDTYVRLDTALADVLRDVDPRTSTAVILSHGIGPNYHGDHLFPELLRRFNAHFGDAVEHAEMVGRLERVWGTTIGRLPETFRRSIKTRLPLRLRRWASAKRAEQPDHWRRSRSFAMPGLDGFSAVRVNVAGREPHGRVAPGEMYRAYLVQLEAEIRSWTNAETGQPAVERIYRVDDATDPLGIGGGPDLMLWWSKARVIRTVRSERLGSVSGRPAADRSGEHIMHSLFLIRAAGYPAGRKFITGMQPIDVAPTLCELAGVAPNSVYRGRSRCKELLSKVG